MQGSYLKHLIENLQQKIRSEGRPVVSNNQGTIELLNEEFTISYENLIDMDDINRSMRRYYFQNNLDIQELQELEKDEYANIENVLYEKFKMFDEDMHSRRVLWSDDCCISLIHFLIRDKTILCYVNLRSSDVIYKLFSDLTLIHKITSNLQQKLNIKNAIIEVNAHSLHEIAINKIKKDV